MTQRRLRENEWRPPPETESPVSVSASERLRATALAFAAQYLIPPNPISKWDYRQMFTCIKWPDEVHKVRSAHLLSRPAKPMRFLFSLFASGLLPLLLTNSALLSSARHTRDLAFDALAFRRQVVTCPAVNRALNKTVDLHLRTHLTSRPVTSSSA